MVLFLFYFIKSTKMGAYALHAIISPLFAWFKPWVLQIPDGKVYGANMGPTVGRQDPSGPMHMVAPWSLLSGIFY